MRDSRVRPTLWYFVPGIVVILASVGLFAYALVEGISNATEALTQIVVPGGKDLTLMPKVKYTIFLETESVVDGRIYSTTESISGLECAVTSQTSGSRIETRRPSVNATYAIGGREGRSALEFLTQEAGVYHIACAYEDGRTSPQVVIGVGSGVAGRIFSTVAKSFLFLFGGGALGAVMVILVIIKRERSKRQFARLAQAPL